MSITTDAHSSAQPADARDRADMERLAAGHDAALNDLMERHATPVFHFLCRMVGNEDDANDLAQETFVRVFRARGSFRTGEKFSTWIFTIAANLARNHFRWRSRHPNVSLEAETGESEQTLGSTLPATDPAPKRTGARRRARRRRARCRGQIAGRFARGDCAVRMGGPQRGRSRGNFGNDTEGCRIAVISCAAGFAGTAEVLAVSG